MKRLLLICLSLILLISVATSCNKNDDNDPQIQWEFDYTIEKTLYAQGESIRVTVEVTNIGDDYPYVGSPIDLFGPAKLYLTSNESCTLTTMPFANTTDATERVFEKGQKAQRSYEFYSDEQSLSGSYTLAVPFAQMTKTFKNILVLEMPLTDEERAVVEIANAEILEEYPITSLEPYRVRVSKNTKGEYSVKYELRIGNYSTYESYTVSFNADKTVKNVYGAYGQYAVYLPYVTADKINEAEERLTKQVEQYDEHSGFYLSIDDDGYLTLNAEVIVKLNGIFNGDGGCGIDHEHKFFTERICGLQ